MEYGYTHGDALQRGDEIRDFQSKLNAVREVYNCPWNHLTTDGIYGRKTRDAVKAFQIFANVVPVTGNLDAATQQALNNKYAESQRTFSSVKREIGNYQLADANYTLGVGYLDAPSSAVDVVWEIDKAAAVAISKDIIDVLSAVVEDRSQRALRNKLLPYENKIDDIWRRYSDLMNKVKVSPSSPKMGDLSFLKASSETGIDTNRGQLFRRRRELNGKSIARVLSEESEKMMALKKSAAGINAISKIGYGIPVLDVLYHASKWYFAEGDNDSNRCKTEFQQSVDKALESLSFGAMTDVAASTAAKAATGAAGGPVGLAITSLVAILDVVLVSTTGRSLSTRMLQHLNNMDDMVFPKVTTEQISNGMYLPIGNGYYVPGIT